MEEVIREFRIIETDDGFRIEIKGDKEELRDFVMSLDPRYWMHGLHKGSRRGKEGFRAGPGAFFGFGPGPWDWGEEEGWERSPRRRRGRQSSHHRHEPRRRREDVKEQSEAADDADEA
ncbi:MAG: hypothetical protein JXJ20_02605 [Anaerolineae bacterium]|nr:hypothetical protein [Anaerolineae bacterium]